VKAIIIAYYHAPVLATNVKAVQIIALVVMAIECLMRRLINVSANKVGLS
jgi:hypothetical protein